MANKGAIVAGVSALALGGVVFALTRKREIYTCPYCGEPYSPYQSIVRHVAMRHPGAAADGCVLLLSMAPRDGTLIDLSGNENNGIITNAVEVEGLTGMYFADSGYATFPSSSSLRYEPGKEWTWEALLYPMGAWGSWNGIWSGPDFVPPGFFYQSGRLFFYPETYPERYGYVDFVLADSGHIHVAVVCDGTELKTFFGGSHFRDITGLNTEMMFKHLGVFWGRSFQGAIDEVRVYNRALLDDEIEARAAWIP